MKRIAIIGANGQVGTEVCLLLQHCFDVEVVAVCRNDFACVVLRRMGVSCRVGSISDPQDARRLVADCDLVVDFTLPTGNVNATTAIHRKIVSQSQRVMKRGAMYVYVSSQMAFGMNNDHRRLKSCWFSHTVYGAAKRAAERVVKRVSQTNDCPYFILRLGQVHGLLQPVTMSLKKAVQNVDTAVQVPCGPSYTIFCFSIAEALVNICHGNEDDGTTFTAVSTPSWSWRELFVHLGAESIEVVTSSQRRFLRLSQLAQPLKSSLGLFVLNRKERIQAYPLRLATKLEYRMRVRGWCQRAATQTSLLESKPQFYLDGFVGELPGPRLQSLSDSRLVMDQANQKCQAVIDNLLQTTDQSTDDGLPGAEN